MKKENQDKNKAIKRILELCEINNISLYRLAIKAQIPNTTLTNMISKNTMPTLPTIEKICRGFDITLSQFFASEKIYGMLTKGQAEILEIWDLLDEQRISLAKAYIRGLCENPK